jgi:hypothetical protein
MSAMEERGCYARGTVFLSFFFAKNANCVGSRLGYRKAGWTSSLEERKTGERENKARHFALRTKD